MPINYDEIDKQIDPEAVAANAIAALSDHYGDKTHFIQELIQNADDAGSPTLRFRFYDDQIIVSNKGRPFNEQDVLSICSIGDSVKDLTQIGTHGIGFKAVYLWTDAPLIFSGGDGFRIERYIHPKQADPPSDSIQKQIRDGYTVFHLPFKPGINDEDRHNLTARLADLAAWTLLFLPSLGEVAWADAAGRTLGFLQRLNRPHPRIPEERARISDLRTPGGIKETFLVMRAEAIPPDAVIDAMVSAARRVEDQRRIERSRGKPQPIDIAFGYRDDRIVSRPNSVLFAYLPTEIGTGLQFLIQARYQTTLARENIPVSGESPWNTWLIEETARLVADVLPELREAGLMTPSLLEILPNGEDKEPVSRAAQVFGPVREAIIGAFRQGTLIPTQGGGHGHPGSVYYPHTQNLTSLFTAAELTGDEAGAWLDPGIRWGKGERSGTLARDAGVNEWTARQTVDWLRRQTPEWFAGRTADWLGQLYYYLSQQKGVWKSLTDIPLLRLTGDRHARPKAGVHFFPPEPGAVADWLQPYLSDLPILAAPTTGGPAEASVREMLGQLGVKELRPADFIRSWLLERHRPVTRMSTVDLHSHLRLIAKIWGGLLPSERERLLPELIETLWLRYYCLGEPKKAYITRTARDPVYLPAAYTGDTDLETYFQASPETRFLDPGYLDAGVDTAALLRVLADMGVNSTPKRIETNAPLHSYADRYSVPNYRMVENWDLDGLVAALKAIGAEDEPLGPALNLWRILERSRDQNSDDFFKGRFAIKQYSGWPEEFGPAPARFLVSLRETAWLPDEQGRRCAPTEMCVPTKDNRVLLGESVRYLHKAFLQSDEPSNDGLRRLASTLKIRLEADAVGVVGHLRSLSGKSAKLSQVQPLYEFLQRHPTPDAENLLGRFPWIFSGISKGRWHHGSGAYWKDESALLGDAFAYLSGEYPAALKPFFLTHGVPLEASFNDFIASVRESAQASDVGEDTRTRMDVLYQRLCREAQDGLDGDSAPRWRALLAGRFWLGKCGGAWAYHRLQDLSRADQEYRAGLFRDHVPFWSLPLSYPFGAEPLGIEPCSDARTIFRPRGSERSLEGWTSRLRRFAPLIERFLTSETLGQHAPSDVTPGMLERLRVCWTEAADVEYELKGKVVIDPRGLSSHLDVGAATLWLRSDNERQYPGLIGEALQRSIGTSRLDSFVRDLLEAANEDELHEVRELWHQQGLNFGPGEHSGNEGVIHDTDVEADAEPPEDGPEIGEDEVTEGESRPEAQGEDLMAEEDGFRRDVPGAGGAPKAGFAAPTGPCPASPSGTSHHQPGDPDPVTDDPGAGDSHAQAWPEAGPSPSRAGFAQGDLSAAGTRHELRGHGAGGGTGEESPEHKRLKDLIALTPDRLGRGLNLKQLEYEFPSRDRVDVLLETLDGEPVTVEVEVAIRAESPGRFVGVWQAIKYQHLAAVEYGLDCKSVRTVLVAPHFPEDVKAECRKHGVECFVQAIPEDATP